MSKVFKVGLLVGGAYLLASKFLPGLGGGAASPSMNIWTAGGNPARLQAGEAYRVTVKGAPNQPVDVTATKQGAGPILHATGNTATDGAGNLVVSGNVRGEDAGAWSEVWTIGGAPLSTWNFTIAAAGMSGVRVQVPLVFVAGRYLQPRFRVRGA